MITIEGVEYYTSAEVCTMIGYTRSTLMRRVKEGVLGQTKVNGRALFKKSDIDPLLHSDDFVLYGRPSIILWSVKELSDLLGMSEGTIYSKCRSGELPHMRIGRFTFFDEKCLEPIIEELENECQRRGDYVNKEFGVL